MKQTDPELLAALSNDKFTEDMLEMLLKQGDKKTPKSFYDWKHFFTFLFI